MILNKKNKLMYCSIHIPCYDDW